MKTLIKFELKKIFSQKLVRIGILLILLLNIGILSTVNRNDIAYGKELAAKYAGPLTDEKVQQLLADFKPSAADLEKWRVSVAYITINPLQSAVHSRSANADGTWNPSAMALEPLFNNHCSRLGCSICILYLFCKKKLFTSSGCLMTQKARRAAFHPTDPICLNRPGGLMPLSTVSRDECPLETASQSVHFPDSKALP